MIAFLVVFVIFLLASNFLLLRFALRAGRRIRNYQTFFSDTLDQMENAADIFDKLTKRSNMLTDHPDIQALQQVMLAVLDILERYISDGKQIISQEEPGEPEQQ